MKVLVAYMSSTGNTKKVAEAIYGGLKGEKVIKPIKEVETLAGYDLAFLGFPTHGYGPDKKTKEILGKLTPTGKKIALFVTHAAPEDDPEVPEYLAKFKQAATGAELVHCFDCQGELSGGTKFIMRFMGKKLRDQARQDNSKGQPDAARLRRATEFAVETMARI